MTHTILKSWVLCGYHLWSDNLEIALKILLWNANYGKEKSRNEPARIVINQLID